ncbi:MBL fold metallo-hydrolase [uncultured Ruegeria sp.]|uniref:MBL fold metallo-hydrolase n=1 Tax=uncultured Ruegeria sp. TaxID=259304 RepID=UPI002608E1EE|nr:MBL fold metallo-hydrolase [uncultured Ruegeria sp.]
MTLGPLPHMKPQKIAGYRVSSLLDSAGPTRVPGDMLKGWTDGHDVPDWASSYLDAGRMIMAYQSFLVQTDDGQNVLIDCAVGEDGIFEFRPDWHQKKSNWLAHLGQAGLTPDDIDIVFLTHLHFDHTGWLTRLDAGQWVPTFANSRIVTSQQELDFWRANKDSIPMMGQSWTDSIAPVESQIEIVAPGDDIEGLIVVDLAGHSPGMIGLEVQVDGRAVASFNADLMHHPLQMAHPDLATIFCSDADSAIATRRAKLAQYATEKTVMFCNHFPGASAGIPVADGDGFRFEPI